MYLIFSFFLLAIMSSASDNYLPYANAYSMDIYVRGPSAVISCADVYLDQCNYLGRADNYGHLRAIVPPGYHSLFATKYVYELNRWYCGSSNINFPVSVITMEGPFVQDLPGTISNPCNIC
ncbi:MAG: hypothetical protein LUQ38_00365 [Methanotrichaceae archaeon]|nr:hypothetical protein [Methanotrichaceae archaeon]